MQPSNDAAAYAAALDKVRLARDRFRALRDAAPRNSYDRAALRRVSVKLEEAYKLLDDGLPDVDVCP